MAPPPPRRARREALRRIRRAGLCLAALAAAAGPARADVPAAASRDGLAASRAFAALADRQRGALPALSDPEAAPVLARLWNSAAVLAGRPQGTRDVDALIAWSDAADAIVRRYVQEGGAGTERAALQRNFVRHQAEIARGTAFTLHVAGNLRDAIHARAAADADDGRGVDPAALERTLAPQRARLGNGYMSTAISVMRMVTTPGFAPENGAVLLAALADELPRFAEGLSFDEAWRLSGWARDLGGSPLAGPAGPALARLVALRADAVEGRVPVRLPDATAWHRLVGERLAARMAVRASETAAQAPAGAPGPRRPVIVTLRIAPDGRLAEARVATPDPEAALNAAAILVARSAAPFPPPPADALAETGAEGGARAVVLDVRIDLDPREAARAGTRAPEAPAAETLAPALAARVRPCWSPPPGSAAVRLRVRLDAAGAVLDQPEALDGGGEPGVRAAQASARRALLRCGPYPEVAARGGAGALDLTVTFDPGTE